MSLEVQVKLVYNFVLIFSVTGQDFAWVTKEAQQPASCLNVKAENRISSLTPVLLQHFARSHPGYQSHYHT